MAVQLTLIDTVPLSEPVRAYDNDGNSLDTDLKLSPELEMWLRNLADTINTNLQLIQAAIP